VAHLLERTICIGLSYLLNIVLAIYDKEVFVGFSSPRGFPRINVVSCECVFLSDLVLMLLLSIEMQRTIIMA
jgi:hypothetical protein